MWNDGDSKIGGHYTVPAWVLLRDNTLWLCYISVSQANKALIALFFWAVFSVFFFLSFQYCIINNSEFTNSVPTWSKEWACLLSSIIKIYIQGSKCLTWNAYQLYTGINQLALLYHPMGTKTKKYLCSGYNSSE